MSETKQNYKYLLLATAILSIFTGLVWGNMEQIKKAFGFASLVTDLSACKTASATTTLNSLTPGLATTTGATISCPVESSNFARIFAWEVASSTKTRYNYLIEDTIDGVDYFERGGSLTLNATTTQLTNNQLFSHAFASSTIETQIEVNFGGRGTTSAKLLVFDIPTLGARKLKVSAYLSEADGNSLATSSDNGMIHMQLVPVTVLAR